MARILFKDGGMGQELIRRAGKPAHPLWSVKVMMDTPDLVRAAHVDFLHAGAKVITLNTYTATPERLAREGMGDLFEPLQAQALTLAREAIAESGEEGIAIAACLPPLHASYRPDMSRSAADMLPMYRRLAEVQAPGCDMVLAETLSSVAEAEAAVMAGRETGLPTWVSVSLMDEVEGAPRLRSGELLDDAIAVLIAHRPAGISLNCSRPEVISAHLSHLAGQGLPFGAYANGFRSIDALEVGGTVAGLQAREDVTPESYAEAAMGWIEMGASFVGGCCEVGPAHIAYLAKQLREAGHDLVGVS